MPDNKQYYVQIPAGGDGQAQDRIVDAQSYENHKDELFNTYKNASVKELTNIDPTKAFEFRPDDEFEISLDDVGEKKVVGAQQFIDNMDKLYQAYPNARVTRRRNVNYWGGKLDQLNNQIGQLESNRNEALKAYNGANWDITDEEQNPSEAIAAARSSMNSKEELEVIDKRLEKLYREREENPEWQNGKLRQIETLSATLSDMDKKQKALARKYPEAYKAYWSAHSGSRGGMKLLGSDKGQDPSFNRDLESLAAAKLMYDEALKVAKAPSRYDKTAGFANFFRGLAGGADEIFTPADLVKAGLNMHLVDAIKRIQDAEGANANIIELIQKPEYLGYLSDGEKELVKAFVVRTAIDAQRAGDLSLGYQSGQTAAHSLGFMADYLMFGGIGDSAAQQATKGITKGLAKASVNLGLQGTKRSVAMAAPKFIEGTLRSAVKALVMSPLMPSSYANLTNGLLRINDAGAVDLSGKAIINTIVNDVFIENLSENAGDQVEKLLGIPFKPLGKGMKALGEKAFGEIPFDNWVKVYKNSPATKLLKQAGFNGYIGQVGEEWYGNALRVMIGSDKEALKDFTTVENQIITMTSFAPMSLLGLGASAAQYHTSVKRMGKTAEALKSVLAKNGYTSDKIDNILDVTKAESPTLLAQHLSPVINQVAKDNLESAPEVYKAVCDYARAVADWRVFDGVNQSDINDRREAMFQEISAGTGTDNWYTTSKVGTVEEGEEQPADGLGFDYVRFIDDSDGHRWLVQSETEGKLALVDMTGQKRLLDRSALDEGIAEGTMSDSGPVHMPQFLDMELAAKDKAEETSRMSAESQRNAKQLYNTALPGTEVELGTPESPNRGIIRQITPDGFLVEASDGVHEVSPEQMAGYLGLPYRPSSDEEIKSRSNAEQDRSDDLLERVNTAGGTDIASALGLPEKATLSKVIPDRTPNQYLVLYDDAEGTRQMTSVSEDQLEAIVALAEHKPEAEVKEEEAAETVSDSSAPVDFRGNPLPMYTNASTGETMVDGEALWKKDPEAWAYWNDSNPRRRVTSQERLEYKLKEISGLIAEKESAIHAAALEGVDNAVMDQMEKDLGVLQERAEVMRNVLQKYAAPATENGSGGSDGLMQEPASPSTPVAPSEDNTIAGESQATGEPTPKEAEIAAAREEVETNPTEGQKKAGNYKKGHIVLDGYEISLENPKGSVRSGVDASGKEWSQVMNNDYGYIRMTEGVDGDHIDVFLSDNPEQGNVFVVDQVDPKSREFDEHKVMYGFNSAEEAAAAYLANYEEGWQGLGAITEVSKDEFKKWVDSSHRKTKPFAEYKSVKPVEQAPQAETMDPQAIVDVYSQIEATKAEDKGKPGRKEILEALYQANSQLVQFRNEQDQLNAVSDVIALARQYPDLAISKAILEKVAPAEATAAKPAAPAEGEQGAINFDNSEAPAPEMEMDVDAVRADNGRTAILKRIDRWKKLLGDVFVVHEEVNTIDNPAVLAKIQEFDEQVAEGKARDDYAVRGWFDPNTDKAHIYLPHLLEMTNRRRNLDEAILHEVISHKGLRALMGDKYDSFLDMVWGRLMTRGDRARELRYIDGQATSVRDRRAAADEFLAHAAEGDTAIIRKLDANFWTKLADLVKEIINGISETTVGTAIFKDMQSNWLGNLLQDAMKAVRENHAAQQENVQEEGRTMLSSPQVFDKMERALAEDGISIDDASLLDEYGLKNVTLSKHNNVVTLTHFIVNEQGKGNGTRFMTDLAMLADRNGWVLALTPDTTFGASSVSRLKTFYKRFGFRENKGRNADLAISESMIRTPIPNSEGMPDAMTRFSVVTDEAKIAELEAGEKRIGYRNVVQNEDGSLGSPMAARLGKKDEQSVSTATFHLGEWLQAEENPDMATDDGKINLIKPGGYGRVDGVDYNPYEHLRPTLVNKQFTQAWKRPELVYTENEYPASELTSGYKAPKAKKSVGMHNWNGGKLILSRWDKPIRIVPWEEVADAWENEFGDTGVTFDIVPPSLLPILAERGVEILPPKAAAGADALSAYNEWKAGQNDNVDVAKRLNGMGFSVDKNNDDIRFSTSQNGGLFKGRPFWCGSVNLLDGVIEEVHSFEEAEAADFHHSFIFSDSQVEKMDEGECGFFWVEGGEIRGEWREKLSEAIIDRIKEQITFADDAVRFSVRYSPDEAEARKVAKDIAAETGRSLNTAKRWVKSETSLAAIILDEVNAPYLDYVPDERFAAIKKDSDYPQGTVDFNNICRKRIEFTNLYQRIQKAYPNVIITGEDLAKIRDMMKKRGITVACGLCYVEDRRQLLGEIAKGFIDELKGNFENYAKGTATKQRNAAKFRELLGNDKKEDLNIYDLITLDGSTMLSQEHPGIYAAFQAFNAARGQQAGNLFQGYAEYKREILKWSPAKVKSVNDNGGLRVFSYSDFEAHHLIDLVQIVQDCAKKGVMIQGYTKVPAFARAVVNTNIKLNRSLVPLGDTGIVDGKLAYDPVEGIDINDKDFLESNDNVGNILIGINDEQIRLAMADPFVHYIIPYHSNQSGVLRQMKQTGAWTNYKNEQTDKGPDVGKHGVNIYTDVLAAAEAEGKPIRNEKQFVEKFLSVCKERGWTPRFERFLNKNKKGDYVYTPGYYKLLLDFKLFDEQGRILPQKPVVAEFDDEFNAKILNEYVAGEETKNSDLLDKIYDDIVKALNLDERENDVRFSTTDSPAFKNWFGDSKVVDAEGKPLVVYHGSPNGEFDTFDDTRKETHAPDGTYWFTNKRKIAQTYMRGESEGHVLGAYLSLKNPLVVDVRDYDAGDFGLPGYYEVYIAKGPEENDRNFETYPEALAFAREHGGSEKDITPGGSASPNEFARRAKERGYDGLIVRNVIDIVEALDDENTSYEDMVSDVYVAFAPNQIKSVDNNGDFNPQDDRIRFSVTEKPHSRGVSDPRSLVPKVRGGWTEQKILRYLKDYGSHYGLRSAAKSISEFDGPEELKRYMFYHGTTKWPRQLRPSIIRTDRWVEDNGGGGYGDKYWGISLTKNKKVATNFSGATGRTVNVFPVILRKGATVIERPDFSDAWDAGEHIVELWEQGVDAVWIGNKDAGEEELLVLNPLAIVNIGTPDVYSVFGLGSEDNPINIASDADVQKMYDMAIEFINADVPFGPRKPLRWEMDGDHLGERKSDEQYESEMQEYYRRLEEYEKSDEKRAYDELKRRAEHDIRFSVTAYHGSGADFERFDHSHIGEGQGAQSHGWGTYVAFNKKTSDFYAEVLGFPHVYYEGNSTPPTYYAKELLASVAQELEWKRKTFDELKTSMLDMLKSFEERKNSEQVSDYWKNVSFKKEIEFFENLKEADLKREESHRNLYKVEIPDDTGDNYINEDKTLSPAAREKVADALKSLPEDKWNTKGWHFAKKLPQMIVAVENNRFKGKSLYSDLTNGLGSIKAASEFLSDAGFVGIKYTGRADGPCAVIFDEDDLSIVENTRFSVTATPAFKKWFGDSKVVDAEGNPLEVYHGTPRRRGTKQFFVFNTDNAPAWFTSNKSYADKYAKQDKGIGYSRDVYSAFLKIENPINLGDIGWGGTDMVSQFAEQTGLSSKEIEAAIGENNPLWIWQITNSKPFVDLLRSKGFDGIVAEENGNKVYAVFKPGQIKSATGNNGGYDEANPDIRFSTAVSNAARDLYEAYENQDGGQYPWMSHAELIGRIAENLPRTEATRALFELVDRYYDLAEEDFNEGRRDFSGGEMADIVDAVISDLESLANRDPRFSITTYHGSGADFDRFDHSHMGEGEGGQSYGYGTYVSTNRETGLQYARTIGGAEDGRLYKVEIPDDNGQNYLHWDGYLTKEQSEKIINAVRELMKKDGSWYDEAEYELKSGLGYGTVGRHVEGGLDYFLGDMRNYATDENPGAKRNAELLKGLGIIGMEIPVDRTAGHRYSGSNYVIFDESDLKIVSKTKLAERIESADKKQKVVDGKGTALTQAEIDEVRFSLSKNNKATVEKWLEKRSDLSEEERGSVLNYISGLDNVKLQLATARWFAGGTIRLPEDMSKVEQAVSVAEKAKVDPLQYSSPMELLNAHADFKPSEKRINPEEVSTLHKSKEISEYGIVIYDVDEGKKSRKNMRQIINTHLGKDASPWCLLQGDNEGNLTEESEFYWGRYNAYPKKVAFRNGKLLAFSANDEDDVVWWDKQDEPHHGLPVTMKMPNDELGRTATYSLNPETKETSNPTNIHRGNQRNGLYEEWDVDPFGEMFLIERTMYKDGKANGKTEEFYSNGQRLRQGNYRFGVFVGEYRTYYENGVLRSAYNLDEEGNRDGECSTYNENGKLISRSFFKHGALDGISEAWYDNGNLRFRHRYNREGRNGLQEDFYENGRLEKTVEYKNGQPNGIEKRWYVSGLLQQQGEYKDGRNAGNERVWFDNGQLARNYNYDENGQEHGLFERFYENGVRSFSCHYVHGDREGVMQSWYPNGQLEDQRNYKAGELDGFCQSFHSNGQISTRATYKNGRKCGVLENFDGEGSLWRRLFIRLDGRAETLGMYPPTSIYTDSGELLADAEKEYNHLYEEDNIRFSVTNMNQQAFVSNAQVAVETIQNDKATPEQWLNQLTKNGGLKAAEDKWLGLSDWLRASGKKTITKQEILDFIDRHRIQIEEVHYSEYVDLEKAAEDNVRETIAGGKSLEELQGEVDELKESAARYDAIGENPSDEEMDSFLVSAMKEDYGDDFEMGYRIIDGEIQYNIDPFELDTDTYNASVADNKEINGTRLEYTTAGLKNNREIALTVPTIEPYRADDHIHFGDAGVGRAIAWIRFGETTKADVSYNDKEALAEVTRIQIESDKLYGDMMRKYGVARLSSLYTVVSMEDRKRLDDMDKKYRAASKKVVAEVSNEKKILFIDEIQSKRHQDARERGYRSSIPAYENPIIFPQNLEVTEDERQYHTTFRGVTYDVGKGVVGSVDEAKAYFEILINHDIALRNDELGSKKQQAVPDAPFEKNWHELAMKRMLRLAAEEGYDYVAWTTGEQQAERYDLGQVLNHIEAGKWTTDEEAKDGRKYGEDSKSLTLYTINGEKSLDIRRDGTIIYSDMHELSGKKLSEVLGKDLARKIMEENGPSSYEGESLRIGGEGMKGFYDSILVNFMNKYGKKWGVKVEDIALPDLDLRSAHAVPVTAEMKESVMAGQPMFSVKDRRAATGEEVSDSAKKWYETDVDYVNRLVDDYLREYNEVAPFVVLEGGLSKEEVGDIVGTRGEELDMLYNGYEKSFKDDEDAPLAGYLPVAKKIAIFANEGVDPKQFEEALFHESVHAAVAKYFENRNILEWRELLSTAEAGGNLVGLRDSIKKGYPEGAVDEEEIAYGLSKIMRARKPSAFGIIEELSPASRQAIKPILDEIGYSLEAENERRKRSSVGQALAEEKSLLPGGPKEEDFGPEADGSLFGDLSARYAVQAKRRVAEKVAGILGVEVEFLTPEKMTVNGRRLAGRWQDGHISICPENCLSTDDAVKTVLHEAVGHNGLRRLVGADNMRSFGLALYRQLPDAARRSIIDAAMGKYQGNIVEAVEEWLAERAEDMEFGEEPAEAEKTVWEKIKDAVVELLRRVGIRVPLTDNDVRWMLWQSYHANTDEDLALLMRRLSLAKRLGFSASQQDDRAKADAVTRYKEAEATSAARLYNIPVQSMKARLHEVFVDKDDAVNRAVEAIEKVSGKAAQAFEDVRLALNQQSSKGLAATEKFIREKYNPMMEAIKKIVKKGDLAVEDIERYVKIKHGLERNEAFAKRDARNYYKALADKEISDIKNSNAEQDVKDSLIAREKTKLDKRMERVEKGVDGKYREFRKKDYGGLTAMYSEYDDIAPYMEGVESYEEYQARVLKARHPMYETMEETEEAAAKEVRSFEENVGANLTDDLWKTINAATKATLLQQYKSNLMSRRQYETVRDMFKFYVPLRGFKDNTASNMYNYYMSDNSGEFTPPLLKAGGRKTESESPFGYIGSMASSAITEGMKNETKLTLYYFVTNRPDNDLISSSEVWYENTGMTEDGKRIYEPVYPPLSEDLSADAARNAFASWEKSMEAKAKNGFAYKGAKNIDLNDSVIHIDDSEKAEHIIKFKVNGDERMMFINGNPRAAQAINNMLNVNAAPSELVSALQKVLRYVAMINTQLNPEFWLTNMQRDLLFATMSESVKGDKEFNRNFRRNLVAARKVVRMRNDYNNGTLGDSAEEKLYREFVENGGVTGYSRVIGTEEWENEIRKFNEDERKALRAVRNVFDAIGGFGEAIEQLTRFAAYKTSREAGKGVIEAVADAKELTVNFNRKGSGIAVTFKEAEKLRDAQGKPLSKFQQCVVVAASSLGAYGRAAIVFFNAAVQGLNNMVQLYKTQPKTMAVWTAGYVVLGVINAALHAMLDDDDDDYLDMPADDRGNNLCLGWKGVYFKWALPQEARVFYRLGDVMVNHALGRTPNKTVAEEMLSAVGEVSPIDFASGVWALAPSVATPIFEIIQNEDWTGGRVYNERKFLTKEEREHRPKYRDPLQNTPDIYVDISKALNTVSGGNTYEGGAINWDPNIIEHLFEGYTGGAGTSVEKLMIFLGNSARGQVVVRDTPFLRRLLSISDERYRNAHVTELYYYYKGEAENTRRVYKEALKNGDDKRIEKLRLRGDLAVMQTYESYKKALKTLDDDLKSTPEDQKDQRKDIMRQQDAMRKEMIKKISELK